MHLRVNLVFEKVIKVTPAMLMDGLSDQDLRDSLSKYMDVVPPVTETTRKTLLLKLQKCIDEHMEVTDIENNVDRFSQALIEAEQQENQIQGTKIVQSLPTHNSMNYLLSPEHLTNDFVLGTPKLQSSPILEYASRLPSYRRRSIHPDRPGINDPYADVGWSAYPTLNSSKNNNHIQPKSQFGVGKPSIISSGFQAFLYITVGLFSVVFDFFYNTFIFVITHLRLNKLSFRSCLCLLVICFILIAFIKFLFKDPFYYNPVEDLRTFIRV